jgi:hypothetical protein
LHPGEALSAEAELRPTEAGGKHPPEAKSFGKSSAEDLKQRKMPPPPRGQLEFLLLRECWILGPKKAKEARPTKAAFIR